VKNNPLGFTDPTGEADSAFGQYLENNPTSYSWIKPKKTHYTFTAGVSGVLWVKNAGVRPQFSRAWDTNGGDKKFRSSGSVVSGEGLGIQVNGFIDARPGTVDDIPVGDFKEHNVAAAFAVGGDATWDEGSANVSTKKFDLGIDENLNPNVGLSGGFGYAAGAYSVEGYTQSMSVVDDPLTVESTKRFLSYIENGGISGTVGGTTGETVHGTEND
jgi:hypothetical protein